ncbi:tRNA pseudouridine(55) synthase TruB [Paenibacillus lutrae]|uniref:tRNA pseudouridine synthase B n=1 Tax=Paenibacillus lutrae TaxID=2078573 RepID=A0A7X3FG86_9BACL|nr:tRNA pseudouridine(55) synthase TruB [Paenibacillus lutrae]MVO99111.1 tRNA pseudouridine(55) synthase TruB [Paenibacillus lutrae]
MTLEGILPILKPKGMTSHDVVAKARRHLGIKRIGHTGTLDPEVTGVLPLCIGRATRMVEYIQDLPKEYVATMVFGLATDTEDMSGTVLEERDHVALEKDRVLQVIDSFRGEISQVPPMYSAVKVDGKRLYELARAGVEVERKAREVTIYEIEIMELDLEKRHPEIRFRVLCSKGTYIRTLCVDIGKALGVPAVMKELIRSSSGKIGLQACVKLEDLPRLREENQLDRHIIAADQAVDHLPAVTLNEQFAVFALQGRKVRIFEAPLVSRGDQGLDTPAEDGGLYRIYGPSNLFIGLFQWNYDERLLVPVKVFS